MKNTLLSLLLILSPLAFIPLTAQTKWTTETYKVKFSIKHALGSTADGKFTELVSSIHFSPSNLSQSKITASVASNTFYTGNNSRDKTLKGAEYFDAIKYPKISLLSTKFEKTTTGGYIGYFNVTIKAITKNVAIPFTFEEIADKAIINGTFKINRLDYGVGKSSMMLDDVATVTLLINVKK